ncbi:OST-HTH/LOTUS domain-containing protein [Stenotrophomonas geniculata]|uniref:OST-HTH/LOTUS domain-containing protein n=1 Tax=Stenotrophomonas geniculata TaxID=86188 RepID=UPI003BF7E8FD
MPAIDKGDISDAQLVVQRLLGRCILRLQQYEQLLKSMLALQKLSGTPETLPLASDNRKAEISGKKMGTLVGRLMAEYVMKEGCEFRDEASDRPRDSSFFALQVQLNLPDEDHATLQAELRELVTLRNTLVHHFIEQYDLQTVAGCLQAQDALNGSYTKIDRQFQQLRTLAAGMAEGRRAFAEFAQSVQFRELVVNGIAPDGQIHWSMAGIVSALRQACRELSIGGWVNLETAARWVSEHQPEQTPKKYGCTRWRHVIHESGQFELRRFTHNGQFGAWLRERVGSTS